MVDKITNHSHTNHYYVKPKLLNSETTMTKAYSNLDPDFVDLKHTADLNR